MGSIEAARITKTTAPETVGPLYPGDDSAFCGDVTYPDHSHVTVGTKFVKKWALCNTGNVPWTGRFLVPSGQDIGDVSMLSGEPRPPPAGLYSEVFTFGFDLRECGLVLVLATG